jgi:hypothetical protein
MLSGEAANTNLIVFGLTESGLESTIYCTQDEHVNHYTTDAVKIVSIIITTLCICTKEVFLNYKEMKEFTDEQR